MRVWPWGLGRRTGQVEEVGGARRRSGPVGAKGPERDSDGRRGQGEGVGREN